MILYSFVDGYNCETRYYFNCGEMVFSLVFPAAQITEGNFFPFNPDLQAKAASTLSASDAAAFLRSLYPYDDIQTTNIWPLPIYADTTEEKANNLILRVFLVQYLFPKYWECFLLPWGKEETEAERLRVWRIWFNRFMQLMVATFNKYLPILKEYKAKEASLMARLGSESHSISRFNDTPQNGGDFADEDHTTNATTADNETLSDYETPINRLREIRDKFENLYNAWARDFDILFTKGESEEL